MESELKRSVSGREHNDGLSADRVRGDVTHRLGTGRWALLCTQTRAAYCSGGPTNGSLITAGATMGNPGKESVTRP